jgi:hypothetical protein
MSKAVNVAELLQEAAEQGRIVMVLPASNRPPIDRALTTLPLRQPSSSLVTICRQLFGLTLAESRIFVALLKHDLVTKEELHRAMSDGDPMSKIRTVDVVVCRARQKLDQLGIGVINIHGLATSSMRALGCGHAKYLPNTARILSTRPPPTVEMTEWKRPAWQGTTKWPQPKCYPGTPTFSLSILVASTGCHPASGFFKIGDCT